MKNRQATLLDHVNRNDLLSCETFGPGESSGYTDYCREYGTHCNTHTRGVIGLGAPEHCGGMAVEIENVEDTHVDIIWTDGLAGCMAIAIIGINEKTGKKDVFFTHASHWNAAEAADHKDNPIYYARQFVDSHGPCRILIGTDSEKLRLSGYDIAYAKHKLSKDFGCPVSCEAAHHTLTFFPKLGIMARGNPATAVDNLIIENNAKLFMRIAEEKFYSHPEPNPALLTKLQNAIHHAKHAGCCGCLFGLNEKRQKIVDYLENIQDAYLGNDIAQMTSLQNGLNQLKLNENERKYIQLCNALIQDRENDAPTQEFMKDLPKRSSSPH